MSAAAAWVRLATGLWAVVPSRTTATFEARGIGGQRVTGTLPVVSGHVDVDADGIPSAVHAELDLAGVRTGNARRDKDLGKPDLLGTGVLVFEGGPAAPGADDSWVLPGTLTMKGRTCGVVLAVSGAEQLTATTSLDRRALGVRASRLMIGRVIDVTLDVTLSAP